MPRGPASGGEELHPADFDVRRAEWLRRQQEPHIRRSYWVQLAVFVGLLAVWQLPVINPIKLLVVLFHEGSHVVMGYLTGASIFGIAIDPGGAGVTLGMGGNQLLIVAAGYLGSFLIGYVLYALCAVWAPLEVWMVLCALASTSLFMGWLNEFTRIFGWGSVMLMAFATFVLSERAKVFLVRVVGTASCLYPILDVAGELWTGRQDGFHLHGRPIGSDVQVFADLIGMPWPVIAAFWILAGIALQAWLVPWSARKEAATEVRKSLLLRAHYRSRRPPPRYDPNDPSTIPEYTIQ